MSLVLQRSKADRTADYLMYSFLAVFGMMTVFPLYYVAIMSVTPYAQVIANGGFVLVPKSFTWDAYHTILSSRVVPRALGVSLLVAGAGTALNLAVTTLLAYPLSKKWIPGRSAILSAIVFTMLFQGGIIPLYLVVRGIGLINSLWALVIPALVSSFNLLIMKSYFENLPGELEEAARVDGCGEIRTLIRIILPLSKPIAATMGLFYGVGHWNSYFPAIMYLSDSTLYPVQVVLRNMIQTVNVGTELLIQNPAIIRSLPPESIKMASVVVTIVPVIVVYPFLQKYFIKGMLLGSIKG